MQLALGLDRIPRTLIVCAVATVIAAAAVRSDRGAPRELTAAVLAEGFAVLDGTPDDRHVLVMDRDGGNQKRRAVPVIAPQARMVGTSRGVAMAWLDKDDKVKLARVTGDGTLGEPSTWGKRVTQLCDGVASNAKLWGIGWLERDGRLWVLRGPTKGGRTVADDDDLALEASATRTVWCAVRSAGKALALVKRDSAKRVFLTLCDDKKCGSELRMPIGKNQDLLDVTCSDTACVVALRDDKRGLVLGWMTVKGRIVWSKPLADAVPETTFALTAAGDQAFAVGYVAREGATVARVIEAGSMVRAWADPASQETPALAWASDRLLVAHRQGDTAAPEIVPLPR